MDSPHPPSPPAALVMPAASEPMAYGDRPRWTLVSDRTGMLLTLGRRPPLLLKSKGWRDTPAGRRLTMVTADGQTATLTVVHGLCKPAYGPTTGAMIATFAIGDLRLQGCFDDAGSYRDRFDPRR